jgi:hypothetical protein
VLPLRDDLGNAVAALYLTWFWLRFGARLVQLKRDSGNKRARSSSTPARSYIWRLSVLRRLMCPSTGPLLQGSVSRVFRGKFIAGLKRRFQQHQLTFAGTLKPLENEKAFRSFLRPLFRQNWVVYAKPPFGGPHHVLGYLARYTHRVAITNHRLVAFEHDQVTFRWKDYAHGNRKRMMTLDAQEFLRRFLLHVLPRGFVRIRSFGFLANRRRARLLPLCQRLLADYPTQTECGTRTLLMKEKLYSIKKNSSRSDAWKSFKISKRTLLNKATRHWVTLVSNVEYILALPECVFRLAKVNRRWRQQADARVTVRVVVPAKETLTESATVLDAPKTVRELRSGSASTIATSDLETMRISTSSPSADAGSL